VFTQTQSDASILNVQSAEDATRRSLAEDIFELLALKTRIYRIAQKQRVNQEQATIWQARANDEHYTPESGRPSIIPQRTDGARKSTPVSIASCFRPKCARRERDSNSRRDGRARGGTV